MASDSVPECMTTRLLKDMEKNDMTELEVAYAASSPFGAGIETVCPNGSIHVPQSLNLLPIDGRIPDKFYSYVHKNDKYL